MITGKSAFDISDGSGVDRAAVRRVAARRGARGPGRRRGRGQRRRRGPADRGRRQGDRLRRRAQPRLLDRRRRLRVQPADARSRASGRGRRGRDRRGHRRQGGLRDRRGDRRAGRRAGRASHASPASSSSARSRRSAAPRSPGFDLPTAQRLFDKEGKLDEIARRRQAGRRRPAARRGDREDPAARPRRSSRVRAGGGGRGRHERVHLVPAGLPARLRRHRALRRQLRDRELALDHDRAAHARVRDAPDARRARGGRCSARSWSRRSSSGRSRRSSGSSPASRSRRGSSSSSTRSASRCRTSGLLLETRTIVVSLLVGILVTLLASLRPAIRATRVPPIAAVREGATLPESRFARFRTPARWR